MTPQDLAVLGMAAAGAGLFFAGRRFAKKLSSGDPAFLPAAFLTRRGLAAWAAEAVSWAGALLAAACLLILFS